MLGVSVNDDENNFKKLQSNFIVSNYVSDLDPVVMDLLLPCFYISASCFPAYINWLCHLLNKDDQEACETANKNYSIVCFPEQKKASGKYGLMQLNLKYFHHISQIHLIFIEIYRPCFNIAVSTPNSHWLTDLFWILFLPLTVFKLRSIGLLVRQPNESYEDFIKRTQSEMAEKTKLIVSHYKKANEMEYNNNNKTKLSNLTDPNDELAKKVKEILPLVPLTVIRQDLLTTNNIDNTIERLLTNVVEYTPEDVDREKVKSIETETINMAAESFGKTSAERMESFQQRKEKMYQMLRAKYIKKYGLNGPD